jgi:hypothetical protein
VNRFDSIPHWLEAAVIVAGCAAIGFVAALIEAVIFGMAGSWRQRATVAVLFALLGGICGTVVALDPRAGFATVDRPVLRSVLSGLFGALSVYFVWTWAAANFPLFWVLAGGVVGAFLGWLGWAWVKHVDF